jgi:PDZ domain-containing protein
VSRHLTPFRIAGGLVVCLLAAAAILYSIPSGEYLLLPDIAHPVAPLVHVQGARPAKGPGAIYFLDVFERRASELESLFPWLHPDGTLVPAAAIVPPCSTARKATQVARQEMTFSQRVAAAVALEHLGYRVRVQPLGVIVSQLVAGTNAPCRLQPMDVIVAVDGSPTPTIAALRRVLRGVRPGHVVALRVRRAGRLRTVRVRTVADPQLPGQALVGFAPDQAARITLPLRVSIDVSGVGGPSAGLAFALEVLAKLGRDVTRGYRVAATGEMELTGAVAPIGGVRQKVIDAQRAHVDVLLVPAGANASVARRYAGRLRVIAVRTFEQAVRALASLPPKR